MPPSGQTLCPAMIVRNEAPEAERAHFAANARRALERMPVPRDRRRGVLHTTRPGIAPSDLSTGRSGQAPAVP